MEVALADASPTSAAVTQGTPCWQQILGVWLQLLVPIALNNHPSPSLCSGCREVTLSPAKCNGAAPRNIINLSVPRRDSCLCLLLGAGICSPASLSQSSFFKGHCRCFCSCDVSCSLWIPLVLPTPVTGAELSRQSRVELHERPPSHRCDGSPTLL